MDDSLPFHGETSGIRAVKRGTFTIPGANHPPLDTAPAHRAPIRHPKHPLRPRPKIRHGTHYLGNDITGLPDDHRVSDPDPEPRDLILIMQRRPGDHRPGDADRTQVGDRRQYARPSYLNRDVLDHRRRLFRRKLVRDTESRRLPGVAQAFLDIPPVQLDDDTVERIRQIMTPGRPFLIVSFHILKRRAETIFRIHLKPELLQEFQLSYLRLRKSPAPGRQRVTRSHPIDVIHERFQSSRCRHFRIELTDRAGRRVTDVREGRFPRGLALAVYTRKLRGRKPHLADRDKIDRPREFERDTADRTDVPGHVLAGLPVPARRRTDKLAPLIRQHHLQPVDLQFAGILRIDLRRLGFPEKAERLLLPCLKLPEIEHVIERPLSRLMPDLLEFLERRPSDTERRTCQAPIFRMFRLECEQLMEQRIIRLVGNFRGVLRMIQLAVAVDFRPELFYADFRVVPVHIPMRIFRFQNTKAGSGRQRKNGWHSFEHLPFQGRSHPS